MGAWSLYFGDRQSNATVPLMESDGGDRLMTIFTDWLASSSKVSLAILHDNMLVESDLMGCQDLLFST